MRQIVFLWFMVIAFCSCDEEVVQPYEGNSGIYFDTKEVLLDTIYIQWGLKSSDIKHQKIKLRVNLFGDVATYDREFYIEVPRDGDNAFQAVVGDDYLPFGNRYVIPARQNFAEIEIDLKRNPVLKNEKREFMVRLLENELFGFLYSRLTSMEDRQIRQVDIQRVIVMNEDFPIPWWWDDFGEDYFGEWSATKSAVICDEMGIDREQWSEGGLIGDFTKAYLRFVGKYMHQWLQEHPTRDEDGSWMKMGEDSMD